MFDQKVIDSFSQLMRGKILTANDSDYDSARKIWNAMIDCRPGLIAQCKGTADIVNAVKFACDNNALVSIRGGGHGVAGKAVCDDGLMIDLSQMKAVRVDPVAKTALVQAGARLRDLDHESQVFGLATTSGLVSETGLAGLTLGGGFGYLARKYGLTLDNLVSADVITADGKLLRASENENPDLFWAIRGGGGNFGIVSSFEFQLHEVGPEVYVAQVFYPMSDAGNVLKSYREIMADAPDEFACYAMIANVPPVEPFPQEYHGKTTIAMIACYTGAMDRGEALMKPLTELGSPILQVVGPMPYTALQQTFDAGAPSGGRYYWKAHYANQISDDAIEKIIRHSDPLPGPYSLVGIEPLGGAISRVDPDATAFANRDAMFGIGYWAGWIDPSDDDRSIEWTRDFYNAMSPHSINGVYSNYLDQDDGERIKDSYGSHYDRLQKIKAKYDPDNFFRQNQNIKPKSKVGATA